MVDLEVLLGEELIGYRETKQHEAIIARRTVSEHRDLVHLWLRALEQYRLGVKGILPTTDPDEDKNIARRVRAQFSVIAGNHLQAALESTLAGYYHHAGFSFRYAAELLIYALYVQVRPEEARRWYPGVNSHRPGFGTAWNAVHEHLSRPGMTSLRPMVGAIHDIAKEMNNHGGHPSQETLQQFLDMQGDYLMVGSRYDERQSIAYLDRGIRLTVFLLYEMDVLLPKEEWLAQVDRFWDERCALIVPLIARLEEQEAGHAPEV